MIRPRPVDPLDITLGTLLALRAAELPDKAYLRYEDRVISYGEFDRRVNRVANRLRAHGVRKGDPVGLFLDSSVEFLELYWAVARVGAVMVPLNTAYTPDELQYAVNHSEQLLLFAHGHLRAAVEQARPRCPRLAEVVYVDGPEPNFAGWIAEAPDTPVEADVSPTDLLGVLYTSGTTARPKGVMLHHRSYVLGAHYWCSAFRCDPEDTLYGFFPLFHANNGVYLVVGAVLFGCTFAFRRGFSATAHWKTAREYGATQFNSAGGVTAIIGVQPPDPGDRDHRVRVVLNGINVASIKEDFERRFGVVMLDVYSLTECLTGTAERLDDLAQRHPGRLATCGRPADWVEVRIVDDDGLEVPPGVKGEIALRGPAVCLGYFKDPEATARAIRDAWLYTGDIGYRDQEGFVYFADRKKDMIKRRGENIASAEVERALNMHPAVQESAVIGVPDPFADEEVKAYVIVRPGMTVDAWELVWHCREYLDDFKVPRYIEFRSSFPRPVALPKVLKTTLRAEKPDLTEGCFDRGPKLPSRQSRDAANR